MKNRKLFVGVTLLEMMLVMAIAAIIVVLAVRYYQNASDGQKANQIQDEILNIISAADNIAQGPGTYSGITTTAVTTVAGSSNMITPYGTAITITSQSQTSYSVQIPAIPAGVCASLASKLQANPRLAASVACSGTSGSVNLAYTYDSTK